MNFIDIDLKNNICSDEYVIGYQGESYVNGIRFILPDELVNWNAFIDLENANGDKTRYQIVDIDNNIVTYEFTAVDLKYRGKLILNLVLVKDKQILKPYIGEFVVNEAICAENGSSENVPIILSSNLSNEINKNIESRHEHSNMDVLDKLEESDNGNLIYNGNPINGSSISEECDPTVPEWAKQEEKPTYSADEISGFDEKSKELINNSLQEAKELGLFDLAENNPEVGKILKVISVNEDGTFTCEWADGSVVDDVQINSESIVTDGVANIPIAKKDEEYGITRTSKYNGITTNGTGYLVLLKAGNSDIDSRYPYCGAIAPSNLDYAVKSAMCDGKGVAWTEEEQAAARERINATSHTFKKLLDYTVPDGETLGVGVYDTDMFVIEDISVSELIFSLAVPAISSFPVNGNGAEAKSGLVIYVSEDGEIYNNTGTKVSISSHASNVSYIITELKFLPGGFTYNRAAGYSYNSPNVTADTWTSSGLRTSTSNGIVTSLKLKEGYPTGQILPSGTRIIVYGR